MSEGIIIRHPRIQMSEYAGEYSYLGTTLRQANIEPMPSLSDVRRLVTEYAILPLGNFPADILIQAELHTILSKSISITYYSF